MVTNIGQNVTIAKQNVHFYPDVYVQEIMYSIVKHINANIFTELYFYPHSTTEICSMCTSLYYGYTKKVRTETLSKTTLNKTSNFGD